MNEFVRRGSSHNSTARQIQDDVTEEFIGQGAMVEHPRAFGIVGVAVCPKTMVSTRPKPWVLEILHTGPIENLDKAQKIIGDAARHIECRFVRLPAPPTIAFGGPPPPRGRLFNEIKPGCSISTKNGPSGTLGYFVSDGANIFGLTAAHVVCDFSAGSGGIAANAQAGTSVYQSASEYGTPGSREIGRVVSHSALHHSAGIPSVLTEHDVAVVQIHVGIEWDLAVSGVGRARGVAPQPNSPGRLRIGKFGQRSGYTETETYSETVHMLVENPHSGGMIFYRDQMAVFRRTRKFRSSCTAGRVGFANWGDSGSIVWDRSHRAMGMVVGIGGDLVLVTPWHKIETHTGYGPLTARNSG